MNQDLIFIDRDYIRMETLKSGNNLAVKKVDYDRMLFLGEIYGSCLSIPEKETVHVVPLLEKKDAVFELASTGSYFIPMKELKLTPNKENLPAE